MPQKRLTPDVVFSKCPVMIGSGKIKIIETKNKISIAKNFPVIIPVTEQGEVNNNLSVFCFVSPAREFIVARGTPSKKKSSKLDSVTEKSAIPEFS